MALIFRDAFVEAANTTLASHTPTTGTSWTNIISVGSSLFQVNATDDNIETDGGGGLSDGCLYTADATYSSADYEVTVKTSGTTLESGDDPYILGARIADANNFYILYVNSGIYRITKRVTGTFTDLIAETAMPTADNMALGDLLSFIVNGTTLEFRVNGVLIASTTDAALSAAGKAGVGMGEIGQSLGYDTASQELDDFRVHTLTVSGESSETLRPSAAGDLSQLTPSAGSNFENVDEATIDNDTTYNKTPAGGFADRQDLYNLPAPTAAGSDTVQKVTVSSYGRRVNAAAGEAHAPSLKIDGVTVNGWAKDPGTSYALNDMTFYHNPADGTAWDATDIGGLQAGTVHHSSNLGDDDLRTTQVFVDYTYKVVAAGAEALQDPIPMSGGIIPFPR